MPTSEWMLYIYEQPKVEKPAEIVLRVLFRLLSEAFSSITCEVYCVYAYDKPCWLYIMTWDWEDSMTEWPLGLVPNQAFVVIEGSNYAS